MLINSLKGAMAMPSIRLLDASTIVHTVDAEDGSPLQALVALEWIIPVELVSASVYACLHCDKFVWFSSCVLFLMLNALSQWTSYIPKERKKMEKNLYSPAMNRDGAPIASKSHTHPSRSQTSRLLTSSLSLVYERRVNLLVLVCSLSSHRHSYICFICNSRFIDS